MSDITGLAILLFVVAWALYWGHQGWDVKGLSGHEFRQTQTALTIQAMQAEGFRVDYPTPILGKPWSIPMEFPLYQWAVVKTCAWFGLEIASGARWVSTVSFLMGLPALLLLMKHTGFSWGGSALAVTPVVLAPVYLFYSRTVMIESMAWSASAWFLLGVIRLRSSGRTVDWAVAITTGVVAVLVKATTWAVFCLPWAILFVHDLWCACRSRGEGWKRLLAQSVGLGLPLLLIGFSWVAMADAIKAQNPIAHFLMSGELREFNFGTWDMRLDSAHWHELIKFWRTTTMPWWMVGGGLLLGGLFRRTRWLALMGGAGFFGAQLIFFGLYLRHDYYFYANGAFLGLVVGGVAATSWDASGAWWRCRLPALAALAVVLFVQFNIYLTTFHPIQTAFATGDFRLINPIKRITKPDDVVVVHSPDWSSALAYYTGRRMLTIPDSQMYYHADSVRENIRLLADESVPLLLLVGDSRDHPQWVVERISDMGLAPTPLFTLENRVTAYARADRYVEMQKLLESEIPPGVVMDQSQRLTPVENRIQISGTALADEIGETGITPLFGVLPFGVLINYYDGNAVLLAHATTELYFEIPKDADTVTFDYLVNPNSYQEEAFDGVSVQAELVAKDGSIISLYTDWMSPRGDQSERNIKLDIPRGVASMLLFRVLPGPRGSNAFDQVWLRYLRFE
ncbi:hypothetical protein [Synoicihabitans lomoniglobus]|uniref:Glycosyltransferase RgtA/B/C/D-like domain-containing protein n=1 Tax=Synoicihabitans lomoniglobus TaxID=2909285 RepID=A0AAF0CSQ8_9BACT|nr:hypothetical protein [Opitutaceae bacterium LMO-M01]WED67382.1 hypothetical protein PXH66_11030 [Opitutaceae bacterium LMO-M01]